MRHVKLFLVLILTSGFLFAGALPITAQEISVMSVETLNKKLGSKEVIVVDARRGKDWSSSDSKIKGALRFESKNLTEWAKNFSKKSTYVVYCS